MIVFELLRTAALDALSLVTLPDEQAYGVWNSLSSPNVGTFESVECLQLTPKLLITLLMSQYRICDFELLFLLSQMMDTRYE